MPRGFVAATGGCMVGDFYTDSQGRVRPINSGSDKGGSDKGGGVIVVALLLAALALGESGAGGAAGSFAGDAAAGSMRARTSSAERAAQQGREQEAWQRLGLRWLRNRADDALTCAVHSHGQVRDFFLRTPCGSLRRELTVLGGGRGEDAVVVSLVQVRMPTTGGARELRDVVDRYGTGDVDALGSQVLAQRGVHFTGRYYRSRRSRSVVVIAEAEPLAGRPDPALLAGVAEVAAALPPR